MSAKSDVSLKVRHRAAALKWRKKNPERVKNFRFMSRYGLTFAQVEEMKLRQGGRCAACRGADALHVDHDHKTGAVRALLCTGCNTALGLLKEDPMRIRALAVYIETRT